LQKKPTVSCNQWRENPQYDKQCRKKPTVRLKAVEEETNSKMKHWRKKPTVRLQTVEKKPTVRCKLGNPY